MGPISWQEKDIMEWVTALTYSWPQRHIEYAYAELGRVLDDVLWLEEQPEVIRLDGLRQMGVKEPWVPRQDPPMHTRLHHSRMVAALSGAVATNMPIFNTGDLFIAGLCHDLGHRALGHDVEHAVEILGLSSHERRSEVVFRRLAERAGWSAERTERICSIMREEGAAGAVLSLCDTLSYLIMDGRMCARSTGLDTHRMLDFSLDSGGRFYPSSTQGLMRVLDARADMFRELYHRPENDLAAQALSQTIVREASQDRAALVAAMEGADAELWAFLQSVSPTFAGVASPMHWCGTVHEAGWSMRTVVEEGAPIALGLADGGRTMYVPSRAGIFQKAFKILGSGLTPEVAIVTGRIPLATQRCPIRVTAPY